MKTKADEILFITPVNLSRPSAETVCVVEMCNAFSKHGFNTTLCVPKLDAGKEWLYDYYDVQYDFRILEVDLPGVFSKRGLPGRQLLFSLLASRLGYPGSIIYTRNPWIFFINSVLRKRKSFFEAHQFRFEGFLRAPVYRALTRLGVKAQGRVVCISRSLFDQWEQYGLEKSKMSVAHDGANVEKYSKVISKAAARQKLGIDRNVPMVVYTGSLSPGKGVDVMLRSANRLPKVSFLVVGGTQDRIDALRSLTYRSNVRFVGQVAPKQIPLYQAAADILCLPNNRGSVIDDVTSPLKLFEYMASGRPIVATDIPSLLEILQHGRNALISPAGNDLELASNIQHLLNEPARGDVLWRNAKQDLQKYSWDARVRHLARVFSEACHS